MKFRQGFKLFKRTQKDVFIVFNIFIDFLKINLK